MHYIVKVRDWLTPRASAVCSARAFALLRADEGKWQTCVLRYKSLEDARRYVRSALNRKVTRPMDEAFVRDFRIFVQDGRKQSLVEETLANRE